MVDQAAALLQQGAGYFQKGDFNAVLRICDDLARVSPDHPEADHLRAMALGRLGRINDAKLSFESAAARHPQPQAVFSNMGNALRAAGKVEEAIVAYEKALAKDPNFLNGWFNLGLALGQAGREREAEGAYQKALELNPRHPSVLNNLAVLMTTQGRSEEAVRSFNGALAAQPNLLSALVNRGACLRTLGRFDEALGDHQRAAALAPNSDEAHYQLANTLRRSGDLAAAEQAFQKAISISPGRADIHRDYAQMQWERGRQDSFLVLLDAAIQKAPSAELFELRGKLSFRAGDLVAAKKAAEGALELNRAYAPARDLQAQVLRREGRLGESVHAAAQAHDMAPDDFGILHEYAETLMHNGNFQQAVAVLNVEPPPAHLQKHVALKALAMRASGDEAYKVLYDYDRLTAQIEIGTPSGFADLASFNSALADEIRRLHTANTQPLDQTLFGGTQSVGRLWDEKSPIIRVMQSSLLTAARQYVMGLADDPEHPFLRVKSTQLECAGAWSVVLSSGGGHVDHIHPEGWVSAVYYVRVPEEVSNGEKPGFLRLGASGVAGVNLGAERWFRPIEGTVIFFPSYMWHGVEAFDASSQRITAPFDLAPSLRSH